MNIYIAIVVTIILIHQIITRRSIMNDFDTVLAAIDAATTAAAARVDALIASLKDSGAILSDEQQAEADAIVAHLNAIGSDPANPAPEPTA